MNWLEYVSELILIGLLYIMLFFVKENKLDALVVWDAGNASLALIGTLIIINFLYLIGTTFIRIRRKTRMVATRKQRMRRYRLKKF